MSSSSNIVLIPARMSSTRLPGKVLADIGGKPMIVQVALRAREAAIGPVAIATDSREVADAVRREGFEAILTRPDHPSGSDRVFEALQALDPDGKIETIVNVQGDLPTVRPETVRAAFAPLENPQTDIATVAAVISEADEKTNPNVVKVVGSPLSEKRLRALYFTRATAPHGDGPLYHHIGLYAWRRDALSRFVSLPRSTLEMRESLEQLRALEAGMRIDVEIVGEVPLGVDTGPDLERALQILADPRAFG